MTGLWPQNDIDHRDGDKKNNRFSNLRDVTTQVNIQNQRRATKANKSGLLGAAFNRRLGKYVSGIGVAGRTVYLGVFETAIEAHEAYLKAKRQLHEGNTL
jgi:hypothetical protein